MEIDQMASTSKESDMIHSEEADSISSRLGMCEVCSITVAKYCCPRCEIKSCSLRCSNIHKKEVECNGERDRARFIRLNKFTDMDMSSDYRLLEEITRSIDTYRKDPARRHNQEKGMLPHFLFRLQKAAQTRHTKLKFLPQSFQRRKINSTRFQISTNSINWHIEWVFPNAEFLRLANERIAESSRLGVILEKHLGANSEEEGIKGRLKFYQSCGLTGVRLFLKAEEKPGNKFYELDAEYTIQENLRGKLLIEYPIIHVVLRDHCSSIDIIDSDDENDATVSVGAAVVDRIIKNDPDEIYTSLKNLLFISDDE